MEYKWERYSMVALISNWKNEIILISMYNTCQINFYSYNEVALKT